MGGIQEHWRIPAATLVSALLVGGAYYLARGAAHPALVQASEESALLQAIAVRDTDADGLPDWEEALYGTDPKNRDTRALGMTDGEAVERGLIVPKAIAEVSVTPAAGAVSVDPDAPAAAPTGTLTDTFAKNFFTRYLSAKRAKGGTPLSQDELRAVADGALASLSASIVKAPDFRSAKDLTVSGTGKVALAAFAANAEGVLAAHGANLPKSELEYLSDAVGGDAAAIEHIAALAKAYRDSAAGLAALSVPAELAGAHLSVVNAFARIGEIAGDFARVDTDPVAAMLALEQYPGAVRALANGLLVLRGVYVAEGAVPTAGAPGASFVGAVESVSPRTP